MDDSLQNSTVVVGFKKLKSVVGGCGQKIASMGGYGARAKSSN